MRKTTITEIVIETDELFVLRKKPQGQPDLLPTAGPGRERCEPVEELPDTTGSTQSSREDST